MSRKIVVVFFSLLLVLGLATSAQAQGKPHVKKPVKKKVKKHNHHLHRHKIR